MPAQHLLSPRRLALLVLLVAALLSGCATTRAVPTATAPATAVTTPPSGPPATWFAPPADEQAEPAVRVPEGRMDRYREGLVPGDDATLNT